MKRAPMLRVAQAASLAAAVLLLGSCLAMWSASNADTRVAMPALPDTRLLDTGKTVLGQPFSYPTKAPAKVTSEIITMAPGAETGWHKHDVPLFGYMLEGELTVDYGGDGTRVYRKGEAFIEAVGTAHNGRNLSSSEVRLLAVFMGADGVPDTVSLPPSQ
jgi:quercetin dioxygenase-like cupin family protein